MQPAHRQPDHLHREPLTTSLEVQTYQDPEHSDDRTVELPATTEMRPGGLQPGSLREPDDRAKPTAPSGLNIELSAPQFLGFAASPSELKTATVTLPEGFTINPDAADGQTMCTEAQANFGSEGPAECPDNSKIGTFSIGTQALSGPP